MKTKNTNEVASGRNRQADLDKDVAYHTKDTEGYLGHFAKPSIMKAGHNTDPMPSPTPGPAKKGPIERTINTIINTFTPKAKAPAEATPQPAAARKGAYGGTEQDRQMKEVAQ